MSSSQPETRNKFSLFIYCKFKWVKKNHLVVSLICIIISKETRSLTGNPDVVQLRRLLHRLSGECSQGELQLLPMQRVPHPHFLRSEKMAECLRFSWLGVVSHARVLWILFYTFSKSWGVADNSVCPLSTHCLVRLTYWPSPKSSNQPHTCSLVHWLNGTLISLQKKQTFMFIINKYVCLNV